jgi:hypothetical protein
MIQRYALLSSVAVGISIAGLTGLNARVAQARPYPDRVGVCYEYQSNELERVEPCVIHAGSGAGAQYAAMRWLDGDIVSIEMSAYCPDQNWDENGFCDYLVNGEEAEGYERSVWGEESVNPHDHEDMPCYRLPDGTSYCYRIN